MSTQTQTKGKTLLVTVGSTQFAELSDAVLAESTIAALRAAGVSTLIVQLGFAPIPAHVAAVVGREGGKGEVGGLRVEVMRYTGSPGEMDALMRSADGVVSHAGSGSILAALRMPRPLLVVPNDALMDDHQQELAEALKEGGYLSVSDVDQLAAGVQEMFGTQHKPFPPAKPERFAAILDETAGFV
ncbi:glycosyl transferase [Cutaneotrichosporon oleaginosum]|uniref:UDP-N-acetylglucosamine transferase subunit ALG13 n=1 Tax=Cutaneotrichosporon oleaginosum TaxID=879819 RepID=A0A0J0XFI0_9TREE|nr:glycosyl transferase [Cutaneotrichosporon oleaginosum]KLT39808.1 glycosyl transferase [Cutaneotrichosporon oleaginosum]TXT10332.1 hypothetical protein COLE_04266 [Cutaneotrichosporon oleaginosum]